MEKDPGASRLGGREPATPRRGNRGDAQPPGTFCVFEADELGGAGPRNQASGQAVVSGKSREVDGRAGQDLRGGDEAGGEGETTGLYAILTKRTTGRFRCAPVAVGL